jgi:diguanylate cyclase (GGDEF)-like protein
MTRPEAVTSTPVEARVWRWVVRHTPRTMSTSGDAVVGGRALLALIGTMVAGAAPLLRFSGRDLVAMAAVLTAMVTVLAVSLVLPWARWPRWAAMAFPVMGLMSLLVIGHETARGSAYIGLIVLCFGYTGLFHRARTSFALVPFAALAYLQLITQGGDPPVPRLLVWILVWVTVGEILAALVLHQQQVTGLLDIAIRTDALTQLGNRRGMVERLDDVRPGDCVVVCDLDHFKTVNDNRGHLGGDVVLERFGDVVSQSIRQEDYAARYGGEEFLLVLTHITLPEATALVERLRATWRLCEPEVTFSAGLGAVTVTISVSAAMGRADAALYRAKAAGRDRNEVSSSV